MIVPVPVPAPKGGMSLVELDEQPRETSLEALEGLRTVYPGGTVTARSANGRGDS